MTPQQVAKAMEHYLTWELFDKNGDEASQIIEPQSNFKYSTIIDNTLKLYFYCHSFPMGLGHSALMVSLIP